MAPLPVENTQRFVIRYASGGNEHVFNIRTDDTITPAAMGTALDAFLDALGPNLYALVILDAVQYDSGSTVSFPVTLGIEGSTYGTGSPSVLNEAAYIDFVGRSPGGRRVKITTFGPTDLGGNYRVNVGEFGSIAAVLAVLNGSPGIFVAIDGQDANWKPYANTGYNSYWEREQRG